MWVGASTPPGSVFGPNGPSDIENLLDYEAIETSEATLEITFDAEVPANEVGLVIMDIDGMNSGYAEDTDRFTVEATNAAGSSLTSSELISRVFNF